ncbi:T9SS type A sorting domain-containing protein [Saccharicrinis sp. FJH54]|uniref:T9SS type A sorting domain-containing protein n=1 Tax=Saccharicrinis sp. FJH54 TaxID=3344665 RepID=UPI0035D4358E
MVYWADGENGGGIIPQTKGERQFIEGDTTINGQAYQIIKARFLASVDQPVFYPPFYVTDMEIIKGFIREDTVEKKVYTLNSYFDEDNIEYLTYDFSLEPGDSLDISYLLPDVKIVLDTIHSIQLMDGTQRKKFVFNDLYTPVNYYYIEGIGGVSSLLYPFDYNFEWGSNLDGVGESGTKIYCQEGYCYVVTANKNTQPMDFSIYPNPAQDFLHLENYSNENVILTIFNTAGKVLIVHEINSNSSNIVNIQNLFPGIYIYILKSNNNLAKGKIIIQ